MARPSGAAHFRALAVKSHAVQRAKRDGAVADLVAGKTPAEAYRLGRQHERDRHRFAAVRAAAARRREGITEPAHDDKGTRERLAAPHKET